MKRVMFNYSETGGKNLLKHNLTIGALCSPAGEIA